MAETDTNFREEKIAFKEENGLVYIDLSDATSEQAIEKIILQTKEALQRLKGRASILINIDPKLGLPLRGYKFRKEIAEQGKEIIKNPGFKKAAVYGPSSITRTTATFIIMTMGVKNIKIFGNKKEALKWLKQ